ncbi:hypothetical protein EDC19_0608 [Natranaerovirga hydrolytica]|uniref:Arsenical resistance operon trans-acting repressor ArsD n=1 Tax=Natranaerovirga hydrolytica TaxID=680378 RepID=A0A4R1MZZ0_9FIRM|nr:hypothetical protein [Natranaerovirga hydrolytica]TCK98190.1 hypothetical protein EDC19_0608 [Natranaerovirga hydrolytica]
MKKINIEVFGISNYVLGKSCCGKTYCDKNTRTNMDLFKEFLEYIQDSDVQNAVQVKFIDIVKDELEAYDYAVAELKEGSIVPLVFINGSLESTEGIPTMQIYHTIKKLL